MELVDPPLKRPKIHEFRFGEGGGSQGKKIKVSDNASNGF